MYNLINCSKNTVLYLSKRFLISAIVVFLTIMYLWEFDKSTFYLTTINSALFTTVEILTDFAIIFYLYYLFIKYEKHYIGGD